jgi:hypothetical protein
MKIENKCLIQNRGDMKISPLRGFDFIQGRSIYNNAIPSGFLKKNVRWNER